MLRRLLPRETSFFEYFEAVAQLSIDAARTLKKFADAGDDPEAIDAVTAELKVIESRADETTHECIDALHKTFITPFDRSDIHSLATTLDDIIDWIEKAGRRLSLYEVGAVSKEFMACAEILIQATVLIRGAVEKLRDLKNSEGILADVVRINELENEADTIHATATAALFRNGTDPLSVMKWREVYEALENAADSCEDIANLLEGIVVENG